MSTIEPQSPDTKTLRALFLGPPRWTLAVAESLTCGRIQAVIGSVSGASDFLLGGITAYSLDQKVRHLGVDAAAARACDAVSAEVATQMALGACRLFDSDFALATTGYAEPNAARGIADPIAYWAVARKSGSESPYIVSDGCLERPGLDRVAVQMEVTSEVLAALEACVRALR